MSVVKKIQDKFRHGLFFKWFCDQLVHVGIEIVPYYWVKENFTTSLPEGMKTEDFKQFNFVELGYDDMPLITMNEGDRIVKLDYLQRKISTPGIKCYALKDAQGQIACFSWFNLNECSSNLRRHPLKPNEAYLFDMYTMKNYRGKNLAVYIRLKCMEVLKNFGKDTFLSISEYFNIPSIKFKQKLNAEFLEFNIRVKVFNKHLYHWRLK